MVSELSRRVARAGISPSVLAIGAVYRRRGPLQPRIVGRLAHSLGVVGPSNEAVCFRQSVPRCRRSSTGVCPRQSRRLPTLRRRLSHGMFARPQGPRRRCHSVPLPPCCPLPPERLPQWLPL